MVAYIYFSIGLTSSCLCDCLRCGGKKVLSAKRKPATPLSPQQKEVGSSSVHFGKALSPELFNKNLPPSTPVRRGGQAKKRKTRG